MAAFFILSALGLAGDLLSKHYVFESLLNQPGVVQRAQAQPAGAAAKDVLAHLQLHRNVCGDVKFTLSTNPGVVFGLKMPPLLVAIVSMLTIGLVFFFFASGEARAWAMHVGLAFIMAGALGNLYDRLMGQVNIPGLSEPIRNQVRDFIDFSAVHLKVFGQDLSYPYIFNVADVLLVVGVALLMLNWLLYRKSEPKPATKANAENR